MNPNDLLLWLSSNKFGTWDRYKTAIEELRAGEELIDNNKNIKSNTSDSNRLPFYQRLRLNLERIGHVEFFRNDFKNGWRVVPPILISVDSNDQVFGILCGARTEDIIDKLRIEADDSIILISQNECPDCIEIRANSTNQLEKIAKTAGVSYQAKTTQLLLAAIPSVDNWQLRKKAEIPFGKDWEVQKYSAETLGWSSSDIGKIRSSSFGLFKIKIDYKYDYYIKLRDISYKTPVQVGKYIILRGKRKNIIMYDDVKQKLSLPISCRPPLLIDRALTLCSGLLPNIKNGQLIYSKINHITAITATNLLRQRMR